MNVAASVLQRQHKVLDHTKYLASVLFVFDYFKVLDDDKYRDNKYIFMSSHRNAG